MLDTIHLTREFRFKKDDVVATLPDPNPEMSVEEVLHYYSGQYPELTTANMEGPKIEGNKAIYQVKTTVGTKG